MTTTWLQQKIIPEGRELPPLVLPRRYENATLDGIRIKSLRTVTREYGRNFWDVAGQGIAPLFVGAAGLYKTYAAAVIAKAVHSLRLEVGWCNCATELVWFDRQAFSSEVAERIQYLKTVPFCVMDDFTQFHDGRQLNTMIEIGTARFDNMLPTLWTGNITLTKGSTEQLTSAVGACLSRRILDTSEGYRVMVLPKG